MNVVLDKKIIKIIKGLGITDIDKFVKDAINEKIEFLQKQSKPNFNEKMKALL